MSVPNTTSGNKNGTATKFFNCWTKYELSRLIECRTFNTSNANDPKHLFRTDLKLFLSARGVRQN